MSKPEYYITIFLIIFTIFTGCSPNKYLQNKEKTNDKNNTPSKTQNINNGVQPDQNKKPDPKPKETEKPEPKPEDTEIGSYQTTLIDKDKDRITNITLASKKINDYVVKPGDVFSFNKVVGEIEPSKGYKKAKIIKNGKKSEGLGGGLCQLSSTIYNAAEKSGLEIVERHPHSKKVGYVPMGKDAAISYGSLDLKFKNNKNYPIKFKTSIENGKIYVWILKT